MMQFDSVKSIINRFPQAAGRAQKYQYIDTQSPFYDALLRYFKYFSNQLNDCPETFVT